MNGILLIDKPKGWTSFDVVAKVRGLVRAQTGQKKPKVGHAGTLDPLATGLLIVLVGTYCKRAQEFSKLDKVYDVEVKLGQNSTTDDEEGKKTVISTKKPSLEHVEAALEAFKGELCQIPPQFSAIKIEGQRAYKQARAGKEVKMEPRKVTIHSITEVKYDFPLITFKAEVSSGTYIRSLARDIGKNLGTGAYMSNLRRISVGGFSLTNAHQIEQLKLPENLLSVITDNSVAKTDTN